jgi:hypothetical protein
MDDMPSFNDKFTIKLTARQQQILELIQNTIATTGSPPTRAEIATEFGFKSANAAEEHLKALARKGAIELLSGTSRGIRLKGDSLESINASRSKQFMQQFSLPIPEFDAVDTPPHWPGCRRLAHLGARAHRAKLSVLRAACLRASRITCSKSKA